MGTGDGRLIKLLNTNLPTLHETIGLDVSPLVLDLTRGFKIYITAAKC
jgi:hypothetical protein